MKKMMRFLCLSAVVALAFVSCKKTDTKTIVFSGSAQEYVVEESGEKAYLNTNNVATFEQNDVVKLFNLATTPSKSEMADYYAMENGRYVHFQLTGAAMSTVKKDAFYAFYPGENVTAPTLKTNNKAVFKLNKEQQYQAVNGEANASSKDLYMCAKENNVQNIGDVNFNFQNICGILSLKYWDETGWTIKSIRVEDKYFNLTGDVELHVPSISTDGLEEVCQTYNPANPEASAAAIAEIKDRFQYRVTNGGNSVTLNMPEGGFLLSTDRANPSRFLIVLRPLALAHGYRVIVTDMNDIEYTVVDSNTNKKMMPNLIKGNNAKSLASYHN